MQRGKNHMSFEKEIKETVLAILPKEAQVTDVDAEGPEIAIYTKNPKAFFEHEEYVKEVAHALKKRVSLRTDKTLLTDEEQAKKRMLEIIPADAGIKSVRFNPAFSQVTIEAIKPGLVIGKGGETSKRIALETGWTPNIIRAPTSHSDILDGIRQHLYKHGTERRKILQETAKRIHREIGSKESWVRLTALGGFREVGRNCTMVETRETKVLVDCGINVAVTEEPFPYLDAIRFPINELDAVIITHAHLDHSGFLPYLFKLGYRGPVYSTLPTRDLMSLLQFDYVDVFAKESKEPPYTERDVKEMVKYCIPRDYNDVTDIAPDMRLTLYNAAHILGSSSVHLHIGEGAHNLVCSGDVKFGFTRLFDSAEVNFPRLETLVIESTYGSADAVQPPRQEAEERLLGIIKETMDRNGNVLIPVFAVGRAQEIMLVIENFYRQGRLDAKCYIDGMTREASAIHTAYPEYLRSSVERRILQNDSPFTSDLFEVANWKDREAVIADKKSIILASAGMLTGGPSVHYLHRLADNPNNTMVFVGYQGEGSLGRKIQAGMRTMPITENGKTKELKVRMAVETVEGYSGHSDVNQLISYVRNLRPKPKRVLVNHGDQNNCTEFAKHISNRFKVLSSAPRNLDAVRLR